MQEILQQLEANTKLTVVTATNRLSRRLLHEYNQQQLASGLKAWPTPDILSWAAWVQRQWQAWALRSAQSHVVLTSFIGALACAKDGEDAVQQGQPLNAWPVSFRNRSSSVGEETCRSLNNAPLVCSALMVPGTSSVKT